MKGGNLMKNLKNLKLLFLLLAFILLQKSSFSMENISTTITNDDTAFVQMVQKATFNFFWNEANPANGLIKDRDTDWAPCSIASVGFGLTAICIGIDHQWITREQGRERVLTTLKTFWQKPQGRESSGIIGYKGFFYHFLDMSTAARTWDSELSSIDTALLLAGILYCQEYFLEENADEQMIRNLADSIYLRVDWNWMRNYKPNITLGWTPENGFINAWWSGYNEAMIMNILALGSPTHTIPASSWDAWTSGYKWETYYGYSYITFPPLFGHQYSHCWIDFRHIQDKYTRQKGITYFENSVRATLAQRQYCIDNPGNFSGYSDKIWGITACDGPNGYKARGAPPAQNDDGTIAPTAAGGSIAFTPQYSLEALQYMYNNYKSKIWKNYGFRDAFNLSQNWWASDVIGIDEGAIILMMENYLNEGIWKRFMNNPYIQAGLQKAGFQQATIIANEESQMPTEIQLFKNYPNPFNSFTLIRFYLPQRTKLTITLYNNLGQSLRSIFDGSLPAGLHTIPFNGQLLPSGVYYFSIRTANAIKTDRMVLIK